MLCTRHTCIYSYAIPLTQDVRYAICDGFLGNGLGTGENIIKGMDL